MADPTKYVPAYSYSGWQASNPSRPLPADEVDNDLANVSRSVNETIDALKQIRRSDGKLANQSVGPDQLSPALTIGFTFTGLWVDGRSYSAGDGVVKDDTFYSAKVAHTADVSNAPGNDAYWNELYSLNDIVVTGGMALPRDSFVGDGTTTAFPLSFVPLSKFNLFVQVGGVVQSTDAYSSNGNTLTFASPPPNGYGIEVRGFATTAALVTPEDGSVTTDKLADEAVTTEKMADGAVTAEKIAPTAFADQATAEAGADPDSLMSPLATEQHYDAKRAANADADAGTDDEKFMTAAKVVRWFDSWVTRVFGSDSLPRTLRARFGDVVDLDDWLDGNGTLGTVATNNAQLAKLAAYMAGAGAGKTYRSREGRSLAYSSAVAFPPGIRLRLEGALFRFYGNTLSGTPTITLGSGVDVDALIVHVPNGSFSKRFINVRGCQANLLKVVSDVQINNWGSSNLDFGIQIYGKNSLGEENRIDEVYVDGLNKGVIICGDTFTAADPQRGGYIGYCRVKNYEKGVALRNVDGMSLRGGWANLRSSSAVIGDPGCNGLLLDATANMLVRDWLIEDSAEHGFRCGGDPTGAETKNRNLTINGMTIRRAQQCGFKIWGGDLSAAARLDGAAISNVIVEDAAAQNPATTGFNYSAFLIQHVQFGTFSNLQCFANAQAWTGREGFFLGAQNRNTYQGIRCHNARVNAVRVSEFNAGESSTDFLASNNGLKIEGVYSEGHTGDAVYLDSPSQSLRDIVVTDGNFVGGVNAFNANAIAARFVQPCVYEAAVRGHSGALSALPASAMITTINKRTSVA